MHEKFNQYQQAYLLEQMLGSPTDVNNLFTQQTVINLDEAAEFPKLQADQLNELGVQQFYVPKDLGGKLHSFEEFINVFRAIFRRDVTLGLGYGVTTFMAAVHVFFLTDAPAIKNKLARYILNAYPISVAYHEENHGNDLLNNEVNAVYEHNFYIINGKKWVVNNVSFSKGFTVFAKTGARAGSRDFSLFFVDKEAIDDASISYIPKVKTHGVRGCRIAGINFTNTKVPANSLIGKLGDGVEFTFKAFQITRATLPGMSLGAIDTALRCVVDFANKRNLYGNTIINIPHVKETLVDVFIQLLIADIVSITAARSLHVIPEQMSVIASINKFYIPKNIQASLKDLAVILGARHYIRESDYAIFQKILRDYPVVSLGHSSDIICVNSILPQMKLLLTKNKISENIIEVLTNIFSLDQPTEKFNPQRLKISNNGYNDIINSYPLIEAALTKTIDWKSCNPQLKEILIRSLNEISNHLDTLREQAVTMTSNINNFSQDAYEFVAQYAHLLVALSCIWIWIFNYQKISTFFDQGTWLLLALKKVLKTDFYIDEAQQEQYVSEILNELQNLFVNHQSFSIIPINYP